MIGEHSMLTYLTGFVHSLVSLYKYGVTLGFIIDRGLVAERQIVTGSINTYHVGTGP